MIIPPAKRKQYYERALIAYSNNEAKAVRYGYSCNLLWSYLCQDLAEIKESTATSDKIIKEYLPEYYEVLKERKGNALPNGIIVISPWPPTMNGNAARREALTEAINRVNLLITDKQTLF